MFLTKRTTFVRARSNVHVQSTLVVAFEVCDRQRIFEVQYVT